MFSFLKNKTPIEPTPTVEKGVVKAFFFKYSITYKFERDPKSYEAEWRSDLFFDYREAVKVSREIVQSITNQLNTSKDEFIFIVDIAVKRSTVINVFARNVIELTITNGIITNESAISITNNDNLVYIKPEGFNCCIRKETFFA